MSWPPELPDRYIMWPRPERALVGKGSFGEVWRAKDQHQGVLVALKILRNRESRVQTRMEREAVLAAKIVHPNVIALYDMGRTPEGLPYLAFPMASDGNLRRVLGAPPPWSELMALFGDLLRALGALHSRGFLHLDVKLDNVLLHRAGSRRRNVWLADLGVAIALYTDSNEERLIAGTVGYMPAEQLAGEHQLWGPHTDLFAFGAMAYRLVTGEFPFPQKEPVEAHSARFKPPTKLPILEGYDVPKGLEQVLLPLLSPSHLGRFDRAADVWRALTSLGPTEGGVPGQTSVTTFLPSPGTSVETMYPLGGKPTQSHGTLFPTAKPELLTLTPLDVPEWNRPAPAIMPKAPPKTQHPRRVPHTASLLIHREIPVVGRGQELDLLWQAASWVRTKRRPALIRVEGEHGVGKTRLTEELVRLLDQEGHAEAIWATFSEVEGPHTGLRGTMLRLFPPQDDHELTVQDIAMVWARDRGVSVEETVADARIITDWLLPQTEADLVPDPRVVPLLAEHLALRSWRGLTVLWIEDAHLASSGDLVWELVETLYDKHIPALVITTHTTGYPVAPLEALSARHRKTTHSIVLKPLSEAAAVAMVKAHLPVTTNLARQIGKDTGGNPKYTREILVHWLRAGVLIPRGGDEGSAVAWVKAPGAPPFPKDRQSFAQQRLATALAHDPNRLMALLALAEADEGTPEQVIERLAGEMLDNLVLEGLVEIKHGRPRLVPAELADAVRNWPSTQDLGDQVHRELAAAWAPSGDHTAVVARVGKHLALAGDYDDAQDPLMKAVKAMRHSLPIGALTEWARLLRDVSEATGQTAGPHWAFGSHVLAEALWRGGQVNAAFAEVKELLDQPSLYVGDRLRALTQQCQMFALEGQLEQADAALAAAEAVLEDLPSSFRAIYDIADATLHRARGEHGAALTAAREALRLEADPQIGMQAKVLIAQTTTSKNEVDSAHRAAKTLQCLPSQATASGIAALMTSGEGPENPALQHLESLVHQLAQAGEHRALAEVLLTLAEVYRRQGREAEAQQAEESALEAVPESQSIRSRIH